MLDVGKLATLREVVRRGSFSAAGQALSLTQPAVSRQVSLLERQLGTQLVRRTQQGVHATQAGDLLIEHADAILGRVALAEAQLAELTGLRRGRVRLGSFFTAMVHLSSELAVRLEAAHPALFHSQDQVIYDELVDRAAALERLATGELDLAIVFERDDEVHEAPDDIELAELFRDPLRVLLPAGHRLASRARIALRDLAGDPWVRAHSGGAARVHDAVLGRAGLQPPVLRAGHGDEPVEAQALVAAGRGVAFAYDLNVVLDPGRVVVRPLEDAVPGRRVRGAVMRGHRAPATLAALDVLRAIGRERALALAG